MSVQSVLAMVDLPRTIRDALVHLLLAELTSPDAAGVVASATLEFSPGVAPRAGRDADRPAAAFRELRALRDAVVRAEHARCDRDPLRAEQAGLRRALHDRSQRYQVALERMPRGGDLPTRLAQARVLFGQHLFFEVHEVLEPAWRAASGDERRFLQGLIQAAVAWHHGARGRRPAAVRTASAAAAKLADAPPRWHGFPVAELRAQLERYRRDLACGDGPVPPSLVL